MPQLHSVHLPLPLASAAAACFIKLPHPVSESGLICHAASPPAECAAVTCTMAPLCAFTAPSTCHVVHTCCPRYAFCTEEERPQVVQVLRSQQSSWDSTRQLSAGPCALGLGRKIKIKIKSRGISGICSITQWPQTSSTILRMRAQ